MITLETIRRQAASLPGAEEGTSYGTPGFRVGKRLFARVHDQEDAIVILLDSVEEQQELIAADPDTYYITDHYVGHGAVLVSTAIAEEVFGPILERAWRRVARKRDLAAFEGSG